MTYYLNFEVSRVNKIMTKNLILIYERFKVNEEILNFLNDPNSEILALDYYSHKQLENLNFKHEILDSKLTESDLKKLNKIILDITTTWYLYKNLKNEILFDDINLGWLLEPELHSSLISILMIFFSLTKIYEELKPKTILVSNSVLKMVTSIFKDSDVISIEDEKSEKQFWNLDFFPIKYNFGPIPITIRMPRNIFFILRKYYEKFFIPIFNRFFSNFDNNKKSIVLVDFNPSLYGDLFKNLSNKNKNIFLLNRKRAAIWNFTSFKIVKNNRCIIASYEHHLIKSDHVEIQNKVNRLNKKLDDLFNNTQLFSEIFSIDGFEFWTYISKPFKNFCETRFAEAIYEITSSKKFISKTKPVLIVHFYEVALQEKILIHEARKQNIPSIILQHGTPAISFPDFPEMNSIHGTLPIYNDKKTALWGPIMQKYALEHEIKEDNIIVSGSPRHDTYFHIQKESSKDDGLILVILAQIDKKNVGSQLTNTYIQFENAIKIVCDTLKKITDRKKIIKLHPGDMVWRSIIVEPLIKKIDPEIQIMVDANLPKLIQSSSVVISVGITTVLLEANIFKKPTMTIVFDPQERFSASSSGNTLFFNTDEQDRFENTLYDILKKSETSELLVKRGNEFIKKYLANHGTASEYLANKIDECISY